MKVKKINEKSENLIMYEVCKLHHGEGISTAFRTCWYVSEISLVHCTHVRFLVHHQFRRKCLMHALPRGNLYIMLISPWKVSEPLSMLFVMASTYFFITGICRTWWIPKINNIFNCSYLNYLSFSNLYPTVK